ncbi:MAG: hypothetical protein R2848_13525 [Thermomicrobiales bacterium]
MNRDNARDGQPRRQGERRSVKEIEAIGADAARQPNLLPNDPEGFVFGKGGHRVDGEEPPVSMALGFA